MARHQPLVAVCLLWTMTALPVRTQSGSDEKKAPAPKNAEKPAAAEAVEPKNRTLDELLLFFPSKHPAGNWQPKGLKFSDVWFKSDDDVKLHGWLFDADQPRVVILYAHGNAGNLTLDANLARHLQQKAQATVLLFDYRGYGRSEGSPTVEGVLKDARAARALLAKQARVKPAEIVLMGRSLGGAVVTQLAGEAPARALILESTFSSLKDVATHHYPRLAFLVPPQKLDSIAKIKLHKGPLLQSHGDADTVVPYSLGKKLFDAAKDPKEFVAIRGADHNDAAPATYYRRLEQFLDGLPATKEN